MNKVTEARKKILRFIADSNLNPEDTINNIKGVVLDDTEWNTKEEKEEIDGSFGLLDVFLKEVPDE